MKNLGKNVLLLHVPFDKRREVIKSLLPPLGLLYLASPLQKKGYNVALLDLNVDNVKRKELRQIIQDQNFILITCYSEAINNVKKIINYIKKVNNNAIICCGGPHCNTFGEFIEGADIICIGEAESNITRILDCFISNKSLSHIPGIIYKNNGKLVINQGVMKVNDLDSSLFPARELTNRQKYGFVGNAKYEVATIMSSRGCPFSCYYCSFKLNTKDYRKRSVDNVIAKIKVLVKQGYEFIFFGDDNFLVNKRRVHKLMDAIIREKIKANFFIQGRVDSADYSLYKKLSKAGVILIAFGIESANQDVLKYYNKRTTVKKSIEAISLANKVGIITLGFFIIGAPIETKQHFNKNKKFFDQVPLDILSCSILTYYKDSKMWDDANKAGLIKDEEYAIMSNIGLCNYSTEELHGIRTDLVKHFYINPRRLLRLSYKIVRNTQTRKLFKPFQFVNWFKMLHNKESLII